MQYVAENWLRLNMGNWHENVLEIWCVIFHLELF